MQRGLREGGGRHSHLPAALRARARPRRRHLGAEAQSAVATAAGLVSVWCRHTPKRQRAEPEAAVRECRRDEVARGGRGENTRGTRLPLPGGGKGGATKRDAWGRAEAVDAGTGNAGWWDVQIIESGQRLPLQAPRGPGACLLLMVAPDPPEHDQQRFAL